MFHGGDANIPSLQNVLMNYKINLIHNSKFGGKEMIS